MLTCAHQNCSNISQIDYVGRCAMQILVLPVIVRDLDAQVKHMKEKKVFFSLPQSLLPCPELRRGSKWSTPFSWRTFMHTAHCAQWRVETKWKSLKLEPLIHCVRLQDLSDGHFVFLSILVYHFHWVNGFVAHLGINGTVNGFEKNGTMVINCSKKCKSR